MESPFQEDESNLFKYVDVILKRKFFITGFVLLGLLISLFITFNTEPVYQARATLMVEQESSYSPVTGERMVQGEGIAFMTMAFNTHFSLILSNPVLLDVVKALELDVDTDKYDLEVNSLKRMVAQFKENIALLVSGEKEAEKVTPEQKRQNLVKMLKLKITIAAVPQTKLISITVRDKHPELAQDIANTLAKKYIEFNLATKVASSQTTLEWLNNESYKARMKLEDAEKEFFEYKKKTKLFSIEGKQNEISHKLAKFNDDFLQVHNTRLLLDAKIKEIAGILKTSEGMVNVKSLVENKLINEIYNRIMALEIERSRLSKVFKAKHPKITEIDTQIAENREKFEIELAKELATLKSERKILQAREANFKETIDKLKNDALNASRAELNYSLLQRNVDTSQRMYDQLLSRIKESSILNTHKEESNIRLVDKARIPQVPVLPNKKKNIMLGLLFGLFAGAGIAFFFDYLDQTIRTEEDIKKTLGLGVLAIVPELDHAEKRRMKEGA